MTFADIDNAVFEAGLDAVRASSLAAELQAMVDRGESLATTVRHMIEHEPALIMARPALLDEPQRGVRMLMTALTGRLRETGSPPL